MYSDLKNRIEKECRLLYQNNEKEAMPVYMDIVKELLSEIGELMTNGVGTAPQAMENITYAVEAYKHLDVIGMADYLLLAGEVLDG
ncbi:hypothetical protein [Butyrivibrio sp. MC2013]|uniref:hypothetical protein n=1 Tax=Butyrivibrio sp. MC2013 TaxID=1280686 RepID=UPI0004042CD3|nr:hypothetical protein [Butyrivibrio sp. MC2013]